jgi:predicted exporter
VTRRALLPLALWLAALAAAAGLAVHARYTADLSAFLPRAPSPAQQLLVDQLREGALGRVMLVAIEGADARARASPTSPTARPTARSASCCSGTATCSARR